MASGKEAVKQSKSTFGFVAIRKGLHIRGVRQGLWYEDKLNALNRRAPARISSRPRQQSKVKVKPRPKKISTCTFQIFFRNARRSLWPWPLSFRSAHSGAGMQGFFHAQLEQALITQLLLDQAERNTCQAMLFAVYTRSVHQVQKCSPQGIKPKSYEHTTADGIEDFLQAGKCQRRLLRCAGVVGFLVVWALPAKAKCA